MRYISKKCVLFFLLWVSFANLTSIAFSNETTRPVNLLRTYYTVHDGLSQNEVTTIIKDKHGFLWFGTRGGLNRFDGYEFVHYKPTYDANSLTNPSIETLYSDKAGNIWIGTKGGEGNFFNYQKEQFESIKRLPINQIISFSEDLSGTMWIGTWANGLFEYDPDQGKYTNHLVNNRVQSVLQTPDSTIWAGTSYGLFYRKPGDDAFSRFALDLPGNFITSMVMDADNQCIWMVGWTIDLVRFNYTDFTFKHFTLPVNHNRGVRSYSLLKDLSGTIWVGTWGDGLFQFNPDSQTFKPFDLIPENQNVPIVNYQIILDIFQDSVGDIWVGTDGGGVVRLSERNSFFTLDSRLVDSYNIKPVNAIHVDEAGSKWIGTKGNGLFFVTPAGTIQDVKFIDANQLFFENNLVVRCLFRDQSGNMWVGMNNSIYIALKNRDGTYRLESAHTFFNSPGLHLGVKVLDILPYNNELWLATQEHGLYIFAVDEGTYELVNHYTSQQYLSTGLNNDRITSLNIDHKDRFWVSTYGGLYLFNRDDSKFLLINNFTRNREGPLCNIILSTYIDDYNQIWIGTPCGLHMFTESDDGLFEMKTFHKSHGLADDYINAVTGDGKKIWVSTNAGLSCIDPITEAISNFDISDGVGDSHFSENAVFKGNSGLLYFGGHTNITFFNPKEIIDNQLIPEIVITEFNVLNDPIQVDPDGIVPVSLNDLDRIVLSHREPEFSLKFAALDYKSPHLNQYAYKLTSSGKDGEWIHIGNRRFVSFSNLRPGEYTLHLKGSNSSGVWNTEGRVIQLEILPPPWKTGYAIAGYVVFILIIVYIINRIGINHEKLKASIKIEQIAREQEKELNEYKLQFFTNISHEFSTPLTLISGPVSELQKLDPKSISPSMYKSRIGIVAQNVKHLLNLVNQLLEFRKMERGKQQLQAGKYNIKEFVNKACMLFDNLAGYRELSFSKLIEVDSLDVYFDAFKMEIIINNLLSNAFRYAGEPGKVWLRLYETDTHAVIEVGNSGKGISRHDISRIFERYYQARDRRYYGGAGIGLALVKSFVELHHGEIDVNSTVGEETVFTVKLKKGSEHLRDEDINQSITLSADEYPGINAIGSESAIIKKTVNTGTKGAKVLVVDDNAEVRNYIKNILQEYYDVFEANDGLAGYDAVIELNPDIVISDVMMPNSDGFELCKKIKSNNLTSHIPVILLTARNTPEDKLLGIRKGADGYLFKPFEPEHLFERVKQLIASRNILAQRYKKHVILEPLNKDITSEEELLLNRAVATIEKNIKSANFDYEFLASELGMSASTLYRTMKRLIKQTPGDFIRSIRLKKAASYLVKTNFTISEIVENIGYSDIKNFRKNFKDEFGMTPLEYRKKENETSMNN